MAKMEMYSLRVSRDQKAAWDACATRLGIDTSLFVRIACDTAAGVSDPLMATIVREPDADES